MNDVFTLSKAKKEQKQNRAQHHVNLLLEKVLEKKNYYAAL